VKVTEAPCHCRDLVVADMVRQHHALDELEGDLPKGPLQGVAAGPSKAFQPAVSVTPQNRISA